FAWHGSGGHSAFLPFYFTPWIVILYRRAIDDVRWSAAVAALMALTLFEGGVYPFPFFSLLLIYETLVGWIRPGKRWETLRAALVTAPLILLMGAFRLAPILDTMSRYPRPTKGADAITMLEILDMLTAQAHARKFGHQFVWDEYGTYVGWIGVALFLVGVLWMIWARRWALTGATFLFGSLVLGHGSDFHPWALLHHLPVFDSLRVPSRFAVLATFFLAIGATGAMETARRSFAQHRRRRSGRIAYGLLMAGLWFGLAVLVMDVMETHKPQMRRWNYAALPALAQGEPYHFVSDSRYYQYASFPARNVSNRRCYSGMNYTSARGLWVGKGNQVRFRPRRGGKLEAFDRTTNTITAKVTLRKDATLIFNQTYAHGWTASKGTLVPDRHRRMTVTLPKGTHTVVLTYWPPRFLPAALGSALGLLLALLVALFGRGRRPPKAVAPPETSP
ncbi:MAG: hypothetical protein KC416_16620, partial [Myxococcales bacterium]|nr:hypothetical protein [Myxococcales bacterium]